MNLLVSYQTFQYTAHPRSQINALHLIHPDIAKSLNFKVRFTRRLLEPQSGAANGFILKLSSLFSPRKMYSHFATLQLVLQSLINVIRGKTHQKNDNKIKLSNFSIFPPEQDNFAAFQQYWLAAKRCLHQISVRALIAHNILMSFNILDYYKGTIIYQHCSQLTLKKYIPCNTLSLHLLFLY